MQKKKYSNSLKSKFHNHNIKFSKSGKTRQISSKNSLVFLKKFNPKKVLIHDSARPLVSNKMIKKTLKLLDTNDSAIPFIESEDYIALFTYRINHLSGHLKSNKKDFNTEKSLVKLVGKRRSLLDYLKHKDIERYRLIIKKLNLRK